MKFWTESGSKYEVRVTGYTTEGYFIRRVNDSHVKRGDEEWQELLSPPEIEVGLPATLLMKSLSDYGPDDEGNVGGTNVTMRRTTEVVRIEDVN